MRSWGDCKKNCSKRNFWAHKSTHGVAMEGCLAFSRLRKDRLTKMLNFLIRILRSKNRLAKEACFSLLEDKIKVGWPQGFKNILDKVGCLYFWNEGDWLSSDTLVDEVKERLHEHGIQQWQARKEASGPLSLYSKVKDTCRGEVYFKLGFKGEQKKRFWTKGEGRLILGKEKRNLGVIVLTQSLVRCVGKTMKMFFIFNIVYEIIYKNQN